MLQWTPIEGCVPPPGRHQLSQMVPDGLEHVAGACLFEQPALSGRAPLCGRAQRKCALPESNRQDLLRLHVEGRSAEGNLRQVVHTHF